MNTIEGLSDLIRIENVSSNDFLALCQQQTKRVYFHHELYGGYCSLQEYINCPAEQLFAYLSQIASLMEWTYSLRSMKTLDTEGLVMFGDRIAGITKCYCKTTSNAKAMTVDYHCAWDQSQELWMIYYMRILDAQNILEKPGSVVVWTNCYHPYYRNNPYPDIAPEERNIWVGDGWEFFYAGHSLELQNLKQIVEYRHENNIPVAEIGNILGV